MRKLRILKSKNRKNPEEKNIIFKLILGIIIILGFFILWKKVFAEEKNNFIITEIMYNPLGNDNKNTEWFEILAKENFIINKEWRILDKAKLKKSEKSGKYLGCHSLKNEKNENIKKGDIFRIKKGDYVIFADSNGEFKRNYPKYKGKIFYLSLNLLNKEGEVRVSRDGCKTFIKKLKYNSEMGGNNNGYSLEWDFKNKKWRESYLSGGTPGEKNSKKQKYSSKIRINEILPNPSDDERKKEFIELYNFGEKDVNLKNWLLKDNSKKGKYVFLKKVIIEAKKYLIINRSDFKFALNNSGEEKVFLLNPNKKIVSEVDYKGAKENFSYGFNEKDKKWRWSDKITAGKINIFNKIPEFKIKISKKIYKGIIAKFAIELKNIKKEKIKIKWDFGDGRKSYKIKTMHKYQKEGKYEGEVVVFNGGAFLKKKFAVDVRNFPRRKVKIVSIMPNPKGKDYKNEWMEIKNNSKKRVNLKNWSIATGGTEKKIINHPIYNNFIIKPGKSKKITGKFSHFSLNNKKCKVELRYPDGKIAYKLKYKKREGVKDNEIYKKERGGKWRWVRDNEFENKNKNNKQIVRRKILRKSNEQMEILNSKSEIIENNQNEKLVFGNNGKWSIVKKDKPTSVLLKRLSGENNFIIKNKTLNDNQKVLGVWDGYLNKKVREEDGIYYFNPKVKQKEYYLRVFFRKIFGN